MNFIHAHPGSTEHPAVPELRQYGDFLNPLLTDIQGELYFLTNQSAPRTTAGGATQFTGVPH